MRKYSFKNISNVVLFGDIHCDLKSHLHFLKTGLFVNDEDADKPHPKELEMRARHEARQNARNAERAREFLRPGGFEVHFDGQQPGAAISNSFKKSKKKAPMPFANSMFIFTGDSGIGINSPEYYQEIFEKLNKVLQYNNSYIIFIRGNYDDPSYFDGERINFSNIKAVPDYSIVETKNVNILCIGGAISMDRTWKINQEKRINSFARKINKKLYWENEAPVYNEDALKDILSNIKVDIVITHSAPSFAMPESCSSIDNWSHDDTTLVSDINKERIVFDKVFNTIRELGKTPIYWAYSHFNYGYVEKRAGTIFRSLDGVKFSTIQIVSDINSFIKTETYEKMKKIAKKTSTRLFDRGPNPNHIEEPNFDADIEFGNELADERDEPEEHYGAEIEEHYGAEIEEGHEEPDRMVANEEIVRIGPGVIQNEPVAAEVNDGLNGVALGNAFNGETRQVRTLQERIDEITAGLDMETIGTRTRQVNLDDYWHRVAPTFNNNITLTNRIITNARTEQRQE